MEDPVSAGGGLNGLGDEFVAYYRPDDETLRSSYATGVVVLDTNVLLDLYRLSPTARNSLMNVIEGLNRSIFVPHQVASEFHRGRARAVAERLEEIEHSRSQLDEVRNKAKGTIRHIATRAYGTAARATDSINAVIAGFKIAFDFVDQAAAEYDLEPDSMIGRTEAIYDRLSLAVAGRVGRAPDPSQIASDEVEGRRRADAEEPPGFKDRGKDDNPYGDYLWWAEILRYLAGKKVPLIVVSNDRAKGDWTHSSRGIVIGPDPRLVREVKDITEHGFYMRSTSEFLGDGARFFDFEVSAEAVDEARSIAASQKPAQEVDFADVAVIARVRPDELEEFQAQGWLPAAESRWHWSDVRRASILARAREAGADDDVLARISDFTCGERPPAHNVLVVDPESCAWLRRQAADEYIDNLTSPPVVVIRLRDFERKMRIIQASLMRESETDFD
ncbi:PIN-like domain-containing protein [Mycobacterium sp. 21AC1]|uniref:PIN-like domain-containing protein n=1 Tax=[Mycobacterium] appelbergii TaxID=2939269 RepID=UPI0029394356|nr:PIN-like domain-containing protein [Mycobacterium sp. 21AC1]MDV3124687.1 PIN-like domain-containing protein [Mycobacterium sp. 21AC1]